MIQGRGGCDGSIEGHVRQPVDHGNGAELADQLIPVGRGAGIIVGPAGKQKFEILPEFRDLIDIAPPDKIDIQILIVFSAAGDHQQQRY